MVTPEDELEIQKLENDKNKDIEIKEDLTGRGVIALVEDEESVRLFAKSVLISKGYEVMEFESATKALEGISGDLHRVNLIITDVMMPEMTGPAFITEVRKVRPDIKVIFVSGYGEDAFTEEYGQRRDFHFIPKPFSLKTLVTKVKEVLS
jgi:two-component system cell cycle sensor histidine kinase/response regulator CckA